jgi:hypothetical protein
MHRFDAGNLLTNNNPGFLFRLVPPGAQLFGTSIARMSLAGAVTVVNLPRGQKHSCKKGPLGWKLSSR